MTEPQLFKAAEPQQLRDAFTRVYGNVEEVVVNEHSPTAVSMIVLTCRGEVHGCRWSFGLNRTWTFIPTGSLYAQSDRS